MPERVYRGPLYSCSMASVLWFRKALRLHDNVALHECLQRAAGQAGAAAGKPAQLLPIFVLDPWFVASGAVGAHRMQFLLESLRDLDSQLRALNSRLLVLCPSMDQKSTTPSPSHTKSI